MNYGSITRGSDHGGHLRPYWALKIMTKAIVVEDLQQFWHVQIGMKRAKRLGIIQEKGKSK